LKTLYHPVRITAKGTRYNQPNNFGFPNNLANGEPKSKTIANNARLTPNTMDIAKTTKQKPFTSLFGRMIAISYLPVDIFVASVAIAKNKA
jgi:hypothetical protein